MGDAPPDRRAIVALVWAAIGGVLVAQFANSETWMALAPAMGRGVRALYCARLWQAGVLVAVYVVAPLVVARAAGVRLTARELGLGVGESRRYVAVGAIAVAVALPLVGALSFTTPFRHVYPAFAPAVVGWRVLAAWLPLLALMLWCVEFFHRGFLLAMLRPALGRLALFVMIVPYALTHADLVEALGAVVVGLLLGTLALRSRSIWVGWLVHVAIAFAIEAAAVWQAQRH